MKQEEVIKYTEDMKAYVLDNLPLSRLSDEDLEMQIENIVLEGLEGRMATIDQKVAIVKNIYSSIRGFDILDSIMNDDDITEVMINGADNIFIEKRVVCIK